MIKHVNNLIQGQAVDLAFSVERVIASSFEMSSDMKGAMEKLPQQYKEAIEASYQKSLFKSFDSGYQYGLTLDERVTASIPESLKSSLESDFGDSVKEYSEGIDFDLGQELALAYSLGLEETFEEVAETEEPAEVTAAEMSSSNGFPTLQQSDNIGQKEAIKHMEEYISKLSPEAQNVMRYELGIQYGGGDGGGNNGTTSPLGMRVESSVNEDSIDDLPAIQLEDDTALGSMVGPYAISLLCDSTLKVVAASDIENEECYTIMEHVVTGSSVMEEKELVEAICNSLHFEHKEGLTLAEINDKADELSAELTEACRLPGHFVFLNSGENYSLGFVFNKSAMKPILNAIEVKANNLVESSVGSLGLQPPQGTLSTKIQKEIQNLASIKSLGGNSLRDIKRVSPGIASYVSRAISNYRNGKCTHQELSTLLKASSRELIDMVFGGDGVGYYDYFTKG